jgi:hypothetical protein
MTKIETKDETPQAWRDRMHREHGEGWLLEISPELKAFMAAMHNKYRGFKAGWVYHATREENQMYTRLYNEAARY